MTSSPQQIRNELVETNMGLVYYYAKRFKVQGQDYDDLVQEGALGLMDAAERFDPERGFKFSTYAMWHIGRRIREALRSNDLIRTPKRRTSKTCSSLENDELLEDNDSAPGQALEAEEEYDAIHSCIKQLPARDGIVIRLRHGINTEPLTLREVGNILGVTPERVRQIQNAAEEKLHTLFVECATLDNHENQG